MVWWTNHLGNPNCWSFNPVLTGWISQKNADFDCEGISQNFNNWGKQCHKPAIWELFYQHYIILVHIIYIYTHTPVSYLAHPSFIMDFYHHIKTHIVKTCRLFSHPPRFPKVWVSAQLQLPHLNRPVHGASFVVLASRCSHVPLLQANGRDDEL